ncbi:MAG: DUF4411 family protein [Candidatus Lokiarchaeota archaeon]|nr:DUF4411 family protein [Candidatus Lokiarchaeota archaeon]
MIDSIEEIQDYVQHLVNNYEGWIDTNSTEDRADPYVIAVAHNLNGIVVTQEKLNHHLEKNPDQIPNQPHGLKMPNICNLEQINYLDLLGFIVEIGSF